MTGDIPSSCKGNKGKTIVIKYVEDDVDELPDSDFSKSASILFDIIDIGKYCVLTQSKFAEFIETLGGGFHNEDMAGHLRKVHPNESGSLDHFYFIRCCVDKEVSLDSVEQADRLVGWGCKFNLMDIQL